MNSRIGFFFLALIMVLVACGGGSSPKAVMEKFVVIMEDLGNSMEKADSAAAVATALNDYTDRMEKLIPEMNVINEKHPELKDLGKGGTVPDEYKDIMDRINKAGEKMAQSMMKMGQYYQDEAVQKAQQRMTEVMTKLSK